MSGVVAQYEAGADDTPRAEGAPFNPGQLWRKLLDSDPAVRLRWLQTASEAIDTVDRCDLTGLIEERQALIARQDEILAMLWMVISKYAGGEAVMTAVDLIEAPRLAEQELQIVHAPDQAGTSVIRAVRRGAPTPAGPVLAADLACPNTPPCPHSNVFHEASQPGRPRTCWMGDCPCGDTPPHERRSQ